MLCLRFDGFLALRIPRHIFALAIRIHGQPHGNNGVIAGRRIAFQGFIAANGVLQIAVVERDVFDGE